jgi:hypothetical protein
VYAAHTATGGFFIFFFLASAGPAANAPRINAAEPITAVALKRRGDFIDIPFVLVPIWLEGCIRPEGVEILRRPNNPE